MANKGRIVLIIVVGLVLVAVGVFASYLLLERFRPAPEPEVAQEEVVKTTVVVLARDLNLGDAIATNDVQQAEFPVDIVPRNAVTSLEEAIGKMVKTDLIQGEILLANNLADPTNENNDLAFILSDNHVLMAFPADDLLSRENMVQRGDIIDIFATFTQQVETVGDAPPTGEEEAEPESRTFTIDTMQKVSVTALVLEVIGEEAETTQTNLQIGDGDGEQAEQAPQPDTRIRAYLFALPPQDALLLKHLKDTGAIFDIVLRSPTSRVQFELTPVTAEYIIEFYGLEILP